LVGASIEPVKRRRRIYRRRRFTVYTKHRHRLSFFNIKRPRFKGTKEIMERETFDPLSLCDEKPLPKKLNLSPFKVCLTTNREPLGLPLSSKPEYLMAMD
jgi:hypothetical protein